MRLPSLLRSVLMLGAAAAVAGCGSGPLLLPNESNMVLARQVRNTEADFARTMAARDHEGFKRFLAEDTVFFTGPEPLRGKAAVAAHWKRWFEGPAAPFSWEPRDVEVLDNGTLAMSKGPVYGPDGRPIGSFNSVWRREPNGDWRIVFDTGCSCPDRR
ncbi:YybH family protein [Caldimonas sp. KR1-144]|uniref:YybH family protein n=1 Tax=Caldimonas sp. KR1-144 TaxID=3400911 RepID=UPI003C001007